MTLRCVTTKETKIQQYIDDAAQRMRPFYRPQFDSRATNKIKIKKFKSFTYK